MSSNIGGMSENFRNPIIQEPRVFGGSMHNLQTPLGAIRTTTPVQPPAIPPRPFGQQQSQTYNNNGLYGNSMFGTGFSTGYSPYSSYGVGGGYSGYGSGFNTGGFGTYGGYGGVGYNRFGFGGTNPMDPESRFIQIAEESSRPAFQSIESLVHAIGNIAAMLDSTFFAITSSFRAILGVAANFGRLRGVFAQFWSTFAILRGISWLYKKILFMLKLSNIDPGSSVFREAFAAAQSTTAATGACNPMIENSAIKSGSGWPVLAFLGFIFTAPYIIMKLIGTVSQSAIEESKNPQTWVQPIKATVLYDFIAANPQELSARSGQNIIIAPREVQNTQKLINTGWILATIDNKMSGLIPINYVGGPASQQQQQQQQPNKVNRSLNASTDITDKSNKTQSIDGPEFDIKSIETKLNDSNDSAAEI